MWPEKDIPEDYLRMAKHLVSKSEVTIREFLDLSILAINYIESGQTTLESRSGMALYIANLWVRHKNLDVSYLDDIGGQFAEWEIPGSFIIDDDLHRPYWIRLKLCIDKANAKYAS